MKDAPQVEVNTQTRYLPDQSAPDSNRYVFAYTITIHNHSNQAVQLQNRRWLITDDRGRKQEVAGVGVVGETPIIEAGGQYTYTSGAILETASGQMEGSYEMTDESGTPFEVTIPLFVLIPPGKLH